MVNEGGSGGNCTPSIVNCTFSGNNAPNLGGIMRNNTAFPTIKNSILWGNNTGINENGGSTTITFSITQDGQPGTGNINTNPVFITPVAFSAAPTTSGDLHLQSSSPAINAGTNTGAPSNDLDGNTRPFNGGTSDIGAYESSFQNIFITDFSATPNPVCVGNPVTFTATVGNVTTPYAFTLSNGTSTTTGNTSSTAFSQSLVTGGSSPQTYTLTVSSGGQMTTATTSLTVNALPVATVTLSNGGTLTCAQTSLTISVSGGSYYAFARQGGGGITSVSGAVPDNMLRDGFAVVNLAGVYSITTTVGSTGCSSVTTTSVSSNTATIAVTNPPVTTATQGQPFSQTFTASGGASPYSFSLASGSLPMGLSLASSGVLSGTPSQSGTFNFTVQATDANGCSGVGATYTLVINAACSNAYTVTTTANAGPGSLRQAMLDISATTCPGPFTITATASGTINLASVLPDITKDIAFIGPGASNLTVRRSTGGNYRIFNIPNENTISFNGFTIADGFAEAVDGGAIDNAGILTISNCIFRNNRAAFVGGAIRNRKQLTVTNSEFSSNTVNSGGGSGGGGGIGHNGSLLLVTNTSFSGNSAIEGGGINATNGTVTITTCLFTDNQADFGGGLSFRNTNTSTVINCTFSNNRTSNRGYAICSLGGSQTIVNTTMTANSGNNATLFIDAGVAVRLMNCIVAGNTTISSGGVDDISGTADAASSFNVIGTSGSGGLTNGVNNNQVGVTNALLAPLGNYGGTTQTHALLPGSPAINAGTSTGAPTADQRGVARVGATDMGSFESRGFTLALTSGNSQSATVGTTFANPLRTTVSSANSEPVDGGVVTYTGPGSGAGISPNSVTASIASGVAGASVTANATAGGPYTVTATANGSSPTINFSLTNTPAAPTIAGFAVSPNPVCVGSPVTFTATVGNVTTPYAFTLSNGTIGTPTGTTMGNASSTAFSQGLVAAGNSPQSFTLTVSSNGQMATATTSLTVNALPTASLTNNGPLTCAQTSVTLTASGGTRYEFARQEGGTEGITSVSGATMDGVLRDGFATVNLSGVYSVTVINGNTGCSSTTTTTVTSNTVVPVATISASPSTTLTCAQTSLTLTAGGGNSYAFSGPGVVSQSGSTVVVNASGVYSVTVTNTTTGCFSVTSISISRDASTPVATLSASPSTTLTCAQTSLTLTAGGGNAYAFSGPGVVTQSGNRAVVNASGVYSVTVTNTTTGCFSTTSISISRDASTPVATLSASPSTTLTCAQTSLTLTAGGGNAYAFSPNVASQSGNMAVVNASGVYSVTVTNTATGCS